MSSLYIIVPVKACSMSSSSCPSSCQNVLILISSLFSSFSTHFSIILSLLSSSRRWFSSVISPKLFTPSFPFLLLSFLLSASCSLYQPPRRRPSAVWNPCAATNMGRAAVPAWPASWSKWPGSARPAPTVATHPTAATGGEDVDGMKQW